MMNAGRDKLPDDFIPTMPNLETEAERIVFDREYFDKSVELAGGWPHIHLVSHEYRDSDSQKLARMLLMPTGEGYDFYLLPG